MKYRNETNIYKRISEITGKPENTLRDWEKSEKNNKLFEILKEYTEIKESEIQYDLNNMEFLKKEMIKAIDQLPENKTKKFFHLMMAELAEMGH